MQVLTQRFYLYNYFFSLFQTDKYSSEIRENLSHTGRVVEALIFKSLLLCDDLAVEDNLSYYFLGIRYPMFPWRYGSWSARKE